MIIYVQLCGSHLEHDAVVSGHPALPHEVTNLEDFNQALRAVLTLNKRILFRESGIVFVHFSLVFLVFVKTVLMSFG